jgi:hypothetical protein
MSKNERTLHSQVKNIFRHFSAGKFAVIQSSFPKNKTQAVPLLKSFACVKETGY